MANKTITELPAITSYNDAAVIPIDSGTQTFKISKAKLAQGMQKWASFYHAVIGSADYCTHATLAAALADAALTTSIRVLLTENATIATTIAMNKSSWHIEAIPGVIYTAGAATVCFTVTGSRNQIKGLRISGFTTGVLLSTGATYARVADCHFVSTTTSVDDTAVAGATGPSIYGNIEE